MSEELKLCPFCNGGETRIDETRLHRGVTTNPRQNPVVSAEVKHWCEPEEGQPHRRMITMTGRDRESAIKAWNTHSADTELAAERAKVKSLSEVIESQKQTHDALIKKVEDLQAQLEAAQVTKEATEDLQTVHMIGFHSRDDEVRGLKSQIAVLREALVGAKVALNSASRQLTEQNKFVLKGKAWGETAINDVEKALSIAPSDAAEMMRRKDVASNIIDAMCIAYWADGSRPWNDLDKAFKDEMRGGMIDAIEAARAAGVEVDHD